MVTNSAGTVTSIGATLTVRTANTDLVAHWTLDEGSGTAVADSSTYGNDGTMSGGPTWATGQIGGALSFDGSDDLVVIPSDSSWSSNYTTYTVAFWVKVTEIGNYQGALAVGDWSGTLSFYTIDGKWYFAIPTAGGTNGWSCIGYSPVLGYLETADSAFHHVALVLDTAAGTGKFYSDGELVATDIYVDGSMSLGSESLYLGGFGSSNRLGCALDGVLIAKDIYIDGLMSLGSNSFFMGGFGSSNRLACGLDDVRLYKKALSAAEVNALYSVAPPATPPGGGILSDTLVNVNFQPPRTAIPPGFDADKGKAYGLRSNGFTYGWATTNTDYVSRGEHPMPHYDTFIKMKPTSTSTANTWEIALPNGTYPVIVVMGDCASLEQTNNITIEGFTETDPDPYDPESPTGYNRGDFDGYAEDVTITDGKLTIAVGSGALNPKLCFIEIGKQGVSLTSTDRTKLANAITAATNRTGGEPFPKREATPRLTIWGNYVDDALMMFNGMTKSYLHANHLYSVAAATDASGAIVERYRYDAYGRRSVLTADGTASLERTAIANPNGFTGRYLDVEAGLYYFRARMYSPDEGRFIGRDPAGYVDGESLYEGYFVPNKTDPTGTVCCKPKCGGLCYEYSGNNGNCPSDADIADCCPESNKCGPDVTDALDKFIADLETGFEFSYWGFLYPKPMQMDIDQLKNGIPTSDNCPKGDMCQKTVWYKGQCYYAKTLNWVMAGRGYALTGHNRVIDATAVSIWIFKWHKADPETMKYDKWKMFVWSLKGMRGDPPAPTGPSNMCQKCSDVYTGPFTTPWPLAKSK